MHVNDCMAPAVLYGNARRPIWDTDDHCSYIAVETTVIVIKNLSTITFKQKYMIN